jgi:ATP-dependent Clp protease ATP-binding subunit ClpB
MTSNIGSHLIQDKFSQVTDENTAEIEAKTKVEIFELLKKSIRPEFLNRIDEIMMFKPLSRSDIRGIVDVQFKVLKRMLENQGVEITASNEALDWLSEIGYDPQFGARPLKRAIQREVLNKLSIKILDSTITTDSNIKLDVNEKKEFVFENSK